MCKKHGGPTWLDYIKPKRNPMPRSLSRFITPERMLAEFAKRKAEGRPITAELVLDAVRCLRVFGYYERNGGPKGNPERIREWERSKRSAAKKKARSNAAKP